MSKFVYVLIGDSRYIYETPIVFSSQDKMLNYFRALYPKKKRLRLKRWNMVDKSMFTLLNHNTPASPWWTRLIEVEIDKEENDAN